MKAVLVALLALFALACFADTLSTRRAFVNFLVEHKRRYESAEYLRRYEIFQKNVQMIEEHNARAAAGESTFTMAVNQFADFTTEEFLAYTGLEYNHTEMLLAAAAEPQTALPQAVSCPGNASLGATCDWRAANALTPVKNQGQCGSCWAFSATGATEAAWFLSKGQHVSLSEQNLVDCSWLQLNLGCRGGQPSRAFSYIQKHGINSEAAYPYEAKDGKCRFNSSSVVATISSHKSLLLKGESGLTEALGSVGPISVAIDASHESFRFYKSGVYYEPACGTIKLNHAVLAVGYGASSNGTDYYIVKNSWGTSWGNLGYVFMSRNRSNNCGIATSPSYPIV